MKIAFYESLRKSYKHITGGVIIFVFFLVVSSEKLHSDGTLCGHVRIPKVKDNPNEGWVECYEHYVFVFAEGETEGKPFRAGCPGQVPPDKEGTGYFQFTLPAGTYSLIATEPRFYPRPTVKHDIKVYDGQTTQVDVILNTDYSCLIKNWGDVGSKVYYQTFIASSTFVNRINIALAGADKFPVPLKVTVHKGGINGPQVGPTKFINVNAAQGDAPVSYAPRELPLIPGTLYAVRYECTSPDVSWWAPFHSGTGRDVYPHGQMYVGETPFNADMYCYIGGDCDDTTISYFSTHIGIGDLYDFGWGAVCGQTFVAKGKAIAGVDFFPTIGWGGFVTCAVCIREDGPAGRIVAPPKAIDNPSTYIHGVSWNPNESTLTPGRTYFVEIKFVRSTAQNPGFNIYMRYPDDLYPNGTAYIGDSPYRDYDLNLTILEYKSAADETLDTTPPRVPALHSPSNNTTVTSLPIIFDWEDVADHNNQSPPVLYDLQADNNSNFLSPEIDIKDLPNSSYVDCLPNGVYYWRVRARDSATQGYNYSEWSNTYSFSLNPGKIILPLKNCSFEADFTHWTQHHQQNTTYSIDTSVARTGTRSAKISCASYADAHIWQMSSENSIVPGRTYTFQCWVKTNNVSKKDNNSYGAALRLLWGDNYFSSIYRGDWISGPVGTTTDWVLVSTTVVAPQGAKRVQVGIFLNNATGTVWFDDVCAEESSTTTVKDTIPPANINNLLAQPGNNPGEVILLWWAPGDDGNIGTLNGYYKIQYSKTNGPWDKNSAQITISTSNVQPNSQQVKIIGNLTPGETYYFAVWAADDEENYSGISNIATTYAKPATTAIILPVKDKLHPPYPNPFDSTKMRKITIKYDIAQPQNVSIKIYDLTGNVITTLADQYISTPKQYTTEWNGKDENGELVPAGLYILCLKTKTTTQAYKIIVVK